MDTQYKDEVFLTTPQVMRILGCSRQYISRLRLNGILSTYRKGNAVLMSAKEVEALLTKKTTIVKVTEAINHG